MDQNNASTRSSNVVPLKRGKQAIDEPATASETQASVRATDDIFDPFVPLTWPKGMWAFLRSNVPSNADAAEAYQTWRQLQIEDERNVLLRSIVDAKLATPSTPAPAAASSETCDAWALRHVRWRADELTVGTRADFGAQWRKTGKVAGRWGVWISPILGALSVAAPTEEFRANVEAVRDKLNAAVRAYYRDGKGEGRCSCGAAMNTWSVLTTACKEMQQAEVASGLRVRADNPALGVAPPQPPTKMTRRSARARKKILRPAELMMLAACEIVPRRCTADEWWWWRATFVVLAYLYLRPEEAMVLEWDGDEVDLASKRVHVRRAWDFEHSDVSEDTKTPAGTRDVPIVAALAPLLEVMRERAGGSGLVLPLLRTSAKNFARKFRRFLRHAGIARAELFKGEGETRERQMTLRQLRDTGISWRVALGHNLSVIKKHSGHESVAQVEDYAQEASRLCDDEGRWNPAYGEAFGPLPDALLTPPWGGSSGGRGGSAPASGGGGGGKRSEGFESLLRYNEREGAVSAGPALGPSRAWHEGSADDSLAHALTLAAEAQRWDVVTELARALATRRGQP